MISEQLSLIGGLTLESNFGLFPPGELRGRSFDSLPRAPRYWRRPELQGLRLLSVFFFFFFSSLFPPRIFFTLSFLQPLALVMDPPTPLFL